MPLPPLPLRERRVFVDSSAYLALLDTDDEHHSEAIETLQELAQARYRQFTTNVLLIESHALILSVLGRGMAAQFLKDNPSCDLLEIHELLRSNTGWKSVAPGEEKAHGRENYSDLLSV